jgi:hypothetical protein
MINPVEFGELKGEFKALKDEVSDMKADVKTLIALAENTRGGWRTLMVIGGAGGVIGSFLTKMAHLSGFIK